MSQEILGKQFVKGLIQKYSKPAIGIGIAFLLGWMFARNGGFLILGTGKNIKIEMVEDMCYDGMDSMDLDEHVYIPTKPKYLVIHTDATYPSVKVSHKWYEECFRQKYGAGWRFGYHGAVDKSGKFIQLVELNSDTLLTPDEIAWGVAGYNRQCIHLAYSGGVDAAGKPKNTLTKQQVMTMNLMIRYYSSLFPGIKVVPHNYFNKGKACPSFKDISILL